MKCRKWENSRKWNSGIDRVFGGCLIDIGDLTGILWFWQDFTFTIFFLLLSILLYLSHLLLFLSILIEPPKNRQNKKRDKQTIPLSGSKCYKYFFLNGYLFTACLLTLYLFNNRLFTLYLLFLFCFLFIEFLTKFNSFVSGYTFICKSKCTKNMKEGNQD